MKAAIPVILINENTKTELQCRWYWKKKKKTCVVLPLTRLKVFTTLKKNKHLNCIRCIETRKIENQFEKDIKYIKKKNRKKKIKWSYFNTVNIFILKKNNNIQFLTPLGGILLFCFEDFFNIVTPRKFEDYNIMRISCVIYKFSCINIWDWLLAPLFFFFSKTMTHCQGHN